MSPRPRTVTDEEILAATYRAMSRLGPIRLTLAAVAKEAGISPATLVQRFGSKRGLLLAVSRGAVDFVDECFVGLRASNRSPLDALVAGATDMARQVTSAEEMANHLAFLQIDVSDPEFRKPMLEMSKKTEAGYRRLLDEAVAAGELTPCDTRRLARTVSAITGGSLIGWAVFREGSAEAWVRADLEMLLGPYRADGARPPARARGRARRNRTR